MTRIEARKIIRKASALISNRLLISYQDRGLDYKDMSMYWDVICVLRGNRCRPGTPNYDRVEAYMPNTIPHDTFEQAMNTLTDKMLDTAIIWGIKDATGE